MRRLSLLLLAVTFFAFAAQASHAVPSAKFATYNRFDGAFIKLGTRPFFAGIIVPNQPDRSVSLQRRFGKSWRTVARTPLTHGGRGFGIKPPSAPPGGYTTWRLCLGSRPCTRADKLFAGRNHSVADLQPATMSAGVDIGPLMVDGVRGRGLRFTAPGDGLFAEYDLRGTCRDGGASYGVDDNDGEHLASATLTIKLDGQVVGAQQIRYGPLSQQTFRDLWGVKVLRIEGSGTSEDGQTSHYGLVRGDLQCAW